MKYHTTRTLSTKSKLFKWTFNWIDGLTIYRHFSNEERKDIFSINELKQIIQFTIENGRVPLANNVEKIHQGTEKKGLGSFIYSHFGKDITKAQAASQLAGILVHVGIYEYNGAARNMEFWINNDDLELLLMNYKGLSKGDIESTKNKKVTRTEEESKYDTNKIVQYLKKHKDNIHNLYQWNAKTEKLVDFGILTNQEHYKLNNSEPYISKPYEKEIILKQRLNQKLLDSYANDKELFVKLCLWIIKDWGGINFTKDEETKELIEAFLNESEPSFKRIASLSKVGSYMYPEQNVIYDSRVAYSLNWIILSQNAGDIFFPIPEGRNSKMIAFDMNVLIRLKKIESYKIDSIKRLDSKNFISSIDKITYIAKKKAYAELNKLIKDVSYKLWEGDTEKQKNLFYTEMLLFSIADREIYKDITDRLKLNIN